MDSEDSAAGVPAAAVQAVIGNPSPLRHLIMFFVYVLQSKKDGEFYIGFTPDIKRRMEKHNLGLVQSTKHMRPLELMYCEVYKAKKDALIREKRLKQFAKGFASLKGRLKYSLMSQG